MTGFAHVTEGDLTLTIKSVNHRALDLHFHLPPQFEGQEAELRTLLKEHILRGSVQVRVTYAGASTLTLNRPLLEAWLRDFRLAAAEFAIGDAKPDLNQAFRLPGIFQAQAEAQTAGEGADLVALAHRALQELNEFRDREGAALDAELTERTRKILQIAAEIAQIRLTALPAFQERLRARLAELLGAAIEPQRLVQEAAILADKSDIAEEILRLETHAGHLARLISAAGEKGKKLDFLLQEMNRETNTILSKTTGAGETGLRVTELGLAARSEIDRIREQSLNLE